MRETAKNTISKLRDTMSPDDNAKMRGKETSGRKRLRDGISCDGINKMRRREINDFECMKEAKNIYTRKEGSVLT